MVALAAIFQEGSMKLTSDDTGLFGLVAKALINVFAASDTVKQATIDKCAAISLANSADIKNRFAHQGGFINWYNATLSVAMDERTMGPGVQGTVGACGCRRRG